MPRQIFTISLLSCSFAILLMSTELDNVEAAATVVKRSIEPKNCGLKHFNSADLAAAAKLDRVCEACGTNLYHEPEIYNRCKDKCFDNGYFFDCVKALTIDDQLEDLKKLIIQLDGWNIYEDIKYNGDKRKNMGMK